MLDLLHQMPSRIKRGIFFAADVLTIPLALYLAYVVRFGSFSLFDSLGKSWPIFPILMLSGIPLIYTLGLHRYKLLSYEIRAVMRVQICALALLSIGVVSNEIFNLGVPRTVLAIFAPLFFVGSINSRALSLKLLSILHGFHRGRDRIVIFGAGSAGVQLVNALRQDRSFKIIAFFDDDAYLQGQVVGGLPVLPSSQIQRYVKENKIKRVVVSIPSLKRARRKALKESLEPLNCELQSVPPIEELLLGKSEINSLRTVLPDELLDREKVDLNIPGVEKAYSGKCILVTGAGGSIGSELCQQLLYCAPARIILFDHSEFALYEIKNELEKRANGKLISLDAVLGSITDDKRVNRIFDEFEVDIVLHAAAYKHVPMVEANEIAGLSNNVLGTRTLAIAALAHNVERFILISTDKAVRPTNVMGATKRLAELLIQDMADQSNHTLFSIVRFGNVLGSSGSVFPLFKQQILDGGPLTVTHKDVTRYFMTIPEASRLALLAGSFSTGGDVFVLDMGEPVKIMDLAKRVIEAHGLDVTNEDNPDGDIEISVTGLRPGEKLFEELLIGEGLLSTPHKKILRAKEDRLDSGAVDLLNRRLLSAVENEDAESARSILLDHVDGYLNAASEAAE